MHHIITVYKGELIINFRYRKRDGPTYICHHIGRITEGDETVFVGSRHAGDCGPALKFSSATLVKPEKPQGINCIRPFLIYSRLIPSIKLV